ncbi:Vacuolar protein sorting 60B (Vps60B) [Monocercomonoides exilis]|uniref:Vacuolar protein sorting 60B (Vps60B) n=1 Tax=Monocercomonoides exilis TaxID=2049356 RepID=UPI003559D4AF|nr:Vacuolar protein sorting 60B (Vps60B) [Monocercomonoides exilis]|eukprot:MONOS_12382.1-p1 / transcript=MONOS_12382.1 / gene=MONOS_12382 / organism=Monocercomonoides_exilis_PA203 / gene_product= Vacuolar protein sorting 60B (Vps60B) / transcript_product= Vacuolar protein sorting 60B (Vps60B) / location=Mono_scaffold00681:28250-29381(+) / protein_length=251 / sequence_SO=supercontig / SO=protein_coding / is_pseudo=false
MMKFFGKSTPKETKSLGEITAGLSQRESYLEAEIEKKNKCINDIKVKMQQTNSQQLKAQLKNQALPLLKQRKTLESQLNALRTQNMTISSVQYSTESAQAAAETMSALKVAQKEMEKQFKSFSPDKMEKMLDKMSGMLERTEEINEIIGRSYDTDVFVDESELDAELEMMGDELLMDTGSVPSLLSAEIDGSSSNAASSPEDGSNGGDGSHSGSSGGGGGGGSGDGGAACGGGPPKDVIDQELQNLSLQL